MRCVVKDDCLTLCFSRRRARDYANRKSRILMNAIIIYKIVCIIIIVVLLQMKIGENVYKMCSARVHGLNNIYVNIVSYLFHHLHYPTARPDQQRSATHGTNALDDNKDK